MVSLSLLSKGIFYDVTFAAMRIVIGVIFLAHGIAKVGNDGFVGWMGSMGMPPELAFLVMMSEIIAGIFMIFGVLSRISSAVLSCIMLGVIVYVKKAESLTGDNSYEFDLILLAACLVVIVAGPGRVSIQYAVKKIPKILH